MGTLLVVLITNLLLTFPAESQTKTPDSGVQALMARANAGDTAAQVELGRAYEDGKGVQQDDEMAAQWFRKAADHGDARAQNSLGVMYALGRGVERNKEESVRWYRKAAKGGLSEGFYNLAISYFNGEGVTEDMPEAYAYMMLAKSRGNADADEALQHITAELHDRVGLAKFKLAGLYEKGDEVPQDYAAAAKLYRELVSVAPQHSFEYGMSEFKLCELYAAGKGVSKDLVEAKNDCKLAAKNGVQFANVVLGRMAKQGLGGSPDPKEAADWYRIAAADGLRDGFMELGEMKLASSSHDDIKEAYAWFYLARMVKIPEADAHLQKAAAQLSPKEIASAEKGAEEWRHRPSWERSKKMRIR